MTGNTLVTIDMVTREAQRIAHEKLSFLNNVNRQYDSNFAKSGAKIGDALRIRAPNQYTVTSGSRVMDVQDQDEATQTLTVATQDHVDMRMNSAELTMSIDYLSERYIKPAVCALTAKMEYNALTQFTKDINKAVGAGSFALATGYAFGTAPTDLTVTGRARAMLNYQLAPSEDRFVTADSMTMGGMVNGLKGLFQDSNQVKEQYREGMIGRTGGADWYENEKTWTLTNSGDVSTTLDTYTVVNNDSDITVASMSAAATVGAVFQIAGVYDCNPETKQAYAHLKQFVVTSATQTVIKFAPAIVLSGAKQNVCSSTGGTAAPSTTAAVEFCGSASTSYRQNLMWQKEAFTFVTADLPLYAGSESCVRRVQDGLSMRVWQAPDIRNDELLLRIDVLYGYKTIRPEWACRMSN